MKRLPLIVALGAGAFLGYRLRGEREARPNGHAGLRRRMMKRMLAAMPDDAPPKLVTSILPRLQEQNEQILALLEEQNRLLRRLAAKPK